MFLLGSMLHQSHDADAQQAKVAVLWISHDAGACSHMGFHEPSDVSMAVHALT